MDRKRIRIGVIGVGQIGKHHLTAYQKIPGAEIVAVADIQEAEARHVAQQFNVPNVFTDFRRLLGRDDIEAVDVCLHNNFHAPVTIAALQAGKHVYCEKPMAGAYRDAQAMLDTAKKLQRQLHIQLENIFDNETKAAKELIAGGQLGKLYHARSVGYRRRGRPFVDGYGTASFVQKHTAGGGALYDMGVYHIAAMMYLLDNPDVLRISGKTYQETDMEEARRKSSGYDVEELALGFVRLAGNITLDIIEAWAIHLGAVEGSSIAGSISGIRLEPFGFFRCVGDLNLDSTVNLEAASTRWHRLRETADAYDGSQQHWIAALQGRVELLPTAELALNTMLISEGIYLSDKLGREVTAKEVKKASKSTAIKL